MPKLSTVDAFKSIEVQDDMVVVEGELLKELQQVLETMLKDIDDICTANDIEYQVGGGSCLGAIRHKGFIPWDDDIDIDMPRKDYERFAKIIKEEYSEEYWLHDINTHGYGWGAPRLRRKGTVVRGKGEHDPSECGAWIDICLIENSPDNLLFRYIHGLGSLALGLAVSCRNFARYRDEYLRLAGDNTETQKVFKLKAAIGKVLSFASIDTWCRCWDKWNGLCKNDNSKMIVIPVGRKHYFGELYKRSSFLPSVRVPFGKINTNVPREYDEYLTHMYGNYMAIPKDSEHEVHVVYELKLGET